MNFKILHEKKTEEEILLLLKFLNDSYLPTLTSQVDLTEYARKLYKNAEILYLNVDNKNIGILAYYLTTSGCYITSLGVYKFYHGSGFGNILFNHFLKLIKEKSIREITLEVHNTNQKAKNFYLKHGFFFIDIQGENVIAKKLL